MFASVWIDRHLNFGEQTTNRVESQHAKLKKYLCAKNSSLDKFVSCIDQILNGRVDINLTLQTVVVNYVIVVGECIPLDSIDVSWRKLDLSPSTSVENEDICCYGKLEMFKENFTKQSKVGKKSLLRKLRDIFQPSKTLIKEPTIQKNTRGRPTLKKQQQKRVDSISQAPRRRSHSTTSKSVGLDLVELNKELARHSSYVIEIPDLNQEPSEQ
ncbi:hypothetical protein Gotur_024257, partial [Gossypium turneri]